MTSFNEKKLRLMTTEANLPINKSKIRIKPVLGDEYSENVDLTEAFIGILKQKKDTANAIKSLSLILPGFGHLKRCSGNRLILAFSNNPKNEQKNVHLSFSSQEELKKYLISKSFDLNLLEDDFRVFSVPVDPPRTKVQAQKATQFWPVNFHPDLQIEEVLNGKFFNSTQLDAIEACMRVCIVAAKESIGNNDCNGGTVIFNPNDNGIGRIVAVAAARLNEHPLWHSAMLAVDLVAEMKGGGAWKLPKKNSSTSLINVLTAGCKRKLDEDPFCYPESLNAMNFPKFSKAVDVKSSLKSHNDDDNDVNNANCDYLCTNYWVFSLKEPCALCAMALLHSRVTMIFYGVPNKPRGVLGSKALLHSLAGLNHRYKVWSGVLEDDCEKTALKIDQRSRAQ